MLFLILFSLLSLFFSKDGLQTERFATQSYGELIRYMNEADTSTLQHSGTICSHIPISSIVDIFNMPHSELNQHTYKSLIVNTVKSPFHQFASPTTSFFFNPASDNFRVCTIDETLFPENYIQHRNVDNLGISWMLNTEEIFGSSSGFGISNDPLYDSEINIHIPLEKDQEYAIFYGIMHPDPSRIDPLVHGHFDTAWLREIDYQNKIIKMAWSDNPHVYGIHYPSLSILAIPLNPPRNIGGPEINKDYEVDKFTFTWPQDPTAKGFCSEIKFKSHFEFPPSVFVTTEMNPKANHTASLDTWVEQINELGCTICTSLMLWHTKYDTAFMMEKSGEMKFHYLAFNKYYTQSQMENFIPPTQVEIVAYGISLQNLGNQAATSFFFDFLDFLEIPRKNHNSVEQRINPFYENNWIFIYYHIYLDDFEYFDSIRKTIEAKTHNETFTLDYNNMAHMKFVNQYNKKSSWENEYDPMYFTFSFYKSPQYGNYEVKSSCSRDKCGELGGRLEIDRNTISEGYHSRDMERSIAISTTARNPHCNFEPCNPTGRRFSLHISDDDLFYLKPLDQSFSSNNNSFSILIIIVIVIAAILVLAIILFLFRNKWVKKVPKTLKNFKNPPNRRKVLT